MESERDETDQERVRAVRQPRRDYKSFVCVKDQRRTDEPDEESNRIDARREEQWPVINRNRQPDMEQTKQRRCDRGLFIRPDKKGDRVKQNAEAAARASVDEGGNTDDGVIIK
jgi:hypothetical protein